MVKIKTKVIIKPQNEETANLLSRIASIRKHKQELLLLTQQAAEIEELLVSKLEEINGDISEEDQMHTDYFSPEQDNEKQKKSVYSSINNIQEVQDLMDSLGITQSIHITLRDMVINYGKTKDLDVLFKNVTAYFNKDHHSAEMFICYFYTHLINTGYVDYEGFKQIIMQWDMYRNSSEYILSPEAIEHYNMVYKPSIDVCMNNKSAMIDSINTEPAVVRLINFTAQTIGNSLRFFKQAQGVSEDMLVHIACDMLSNPYQCYMFIEYYSAEC